jgi:KDO2-lipid IV(A) lauroyltransferase
VNLIDACGGHAVVLVLGLARLVPLDTARGISAWLARRIGPLLKGHRIARTNLTAAYPNKPELEIDRILAGMWDNLGRVFAEYAHLDRLWDYDADRSDSGRILLDETTRKRFLELRAIKRPQLVFGAHLANWELLSWACGAYEGASAIVYRPTNISPIDRKLMAMRTQSGASFVAGKAEAYFAIKRTLESGGGAGMLVDEHFPHGVDVTFFGRGCKVTPLLARYARQFDCAIHGGRLIRLGDGRFRLDITEPLAAPRDDTGRIDVAGTMQLVTSIVESWIREHPEQWLWIQRRWR